ncbi:unnamed protein product [Ilex paraguariensis]|uniref:Uncharacterized protein n=1 Tax=Ilex paraguariensis TaxID=185542 RepID=A0ABC8UJR0_9AQUA
MGPRISFSSDFADTQKPIKHDRSYREAPVSSDFEFSVSNKNMISADELFFKGKLLPAKITTLRDELLVDDDDYGDVLPRRPKNTGRWKEKLGLKRAQIVPKKANTTDKALQTIDEAKKLVLVPEEVYANMTGSNC